MEESNGIGTATVDEPAPAVEAEAPAQATGPPPRNEEAGASKPPMSKVEPSEEPGATAPLASWTVSLSAIDAEGSPFRFRRVLKPDAKIKELARSIEKEGLIHPLVVRRVGEALAVEWLLGEAPPEPHSQAMLNPRPEQLAALHAAAMAGNMRQSRLEADRLVERDPAYQPFADMVNGMARAFQSQALLALIESAMEPKP